MRERLARFMAGRNGNDQFNLFLLVADMILLLLATIFSKGIGRVLYPIVFVLLVYIYFRMFSRNLCKRSEENGKYMRLRYRFEAQLRLYKESWVQRKDYKFFTCPSCHAKLRVPRHKGKVKILCRKCGTSFFGKS